MAKRAVLIGVNRYQMPGLDLRGCVNDIKNLEQALIAYCGFSVQDIICLTDLRATKKAMQLAIQQLIASGKRDDVLFFHYSGLGSDVPSENGQKTSRRDQILCPTDLDWNDPLRDDWLRKTFEELRPGVRLTVIVDCCHSGTMTRAITPPDAPIKERFVPCPMALTATESFGKLRLRIQSGKISRARKKNSDIAHADIPEMLITGCRETQSAADARIGDSYNGALTYYLVESIKEANGKLTYRKLQQRVSDKLKKNDFDQTPQLKGQRSYFDRPFLS